MDQPRGSSEDVRGEHSLPNELQIVVRNEMVGDGAAVHAVVAAAFGREEEAILVECLHRDEDAVLALVAVAGHEVVGHVMLSRLSAPVRALGLGPLAVRPRYQRRGIGGLLVRTALREACDLGWQVVFVLGDPFYYRRFGFEAELAALFESIYAGPHLMAVVLGGELPVLTGRIDYPACFSA